MVKMDPAMLKRPASAIKAQPSSPGKALDPEIKVIVAALQKANIPVETLRSTLLTQAPICLSKSITDRHPFEHNVVDMIETTLHTIRSSMEKDISLVESEIESTQSRETKCAEEYANALADVEAAHRSVSEKKQALAQVKRELVSADLDWNHARSTKKGMSGRLQLLEPNLDKVRGKRRRLETKLNNLVSGPLKMFNDMKENGELESEVASVTSSTAVRKASDAHTAALASSPC